MEQIQGQLVKSLGFSLSLFMFYMTTLNTSGYKVLNWKINSQKGCKRNRSGTNLWRSFIHSFINGSTALCWALASSSVSYSFVGLPGRVISPSQGRYLNTGQHKNNKHTHTDIHILSVIRTHDPSFRAGEDSSCLRPRGHCDRQFVA
jgi:hypothetical protein